MEGVEEGKSDPVFEVRPRGGGREAEARREREMAEIQPE